MQEIIIASSIGLVTGALAFWITHRLRLGSYEKIASDLIHKAEREAETQRNNTALSLKQKELDQQRDLEQRCQLERKKILEEDERLKAREDKLESRMNLVEKKLSDIEKKEAVFARRKEKFEAEKIHFADQRKNLTADLERLSGLTTSDAQEELLKRTQIELKAESANLIRKIQKETEEEAERTASSILATAIQRLAVPCVSESTVTTVHLPNDEIKGRIIGREGRNIRALEQATGINFLVDDTPGAIVLSGYDPVRLQIAKKALSELIRDGRIHPTKIEEAVTKATASMEKNIKRQGENAAQRAGALNLHPEIINLLGKLHFRYSYGQNVLEHSLEVSHLLGMMAAELGLDTRLAKRIGLLHDIGKAISHDVDGTHAMIGHDFVLRHGESQEVANGIGCHHNEIGPITVEGSLCGTADAISGSRPGARVEAIEEYVQRIRQLEDLAAGFPGVERAFALQAGREIRVVVLPDMIDDAGTINLARDITKRIETELSYPGKIKVTVIREKRATHYAI